MIASRRWSLDFNGRAVPGDGGLLNQGMMSAQVLLIFCELPEVRKAGIQLSWVSHDNRI